MKIYFTSLLLSLFFLAPAQTKQDTIQLFKNTASLFDLDYTNDEADSMIANLRGNLQLYKGMHKTLPTNDIPFPFAFNPAPFGMETKRKSQTVSLPYRADMQMPKNKNDLAFYSIPELAGLIKTKKITSLELTKFFIGRLKKWGDTLECVITLTEDTAIAQAIRADEEIKNGKYRGVLHGIPYGLKDLFAVKGYKTTWGSTPYKDQMIDEDAYVYTRLKNSGAVLCAKLSMGALANNNKWFGGETKNPWNLKQGSSGSSAGSAAANGAGMFAIEPGMPIEDAKGRVIGYVQQIKQTKQGVVQAVTVEVGDRVATLPAAHFSGSGEALVTGMTKGELRSAAKDQNTAPQSNDGSPTGMEKKSADGTRANEGNAVQER